MYFYASQKKSISMIIFIHLRNENHQMNFIQHVKKNVLYYHFRTTSRLYYSTTLRLKNAEIFFPLPSFDSAQDDKGGEISNKEIKQAPFRVGGNLFYFNYSKQLFRIFHLVTHHQLYDFTNSQIHDSQLYDFTTSHLASHISDLGS